MIKKKKIATPLEELCKGYPSIFKDYMEYCRQLKFEQEPNYSYLINMLENCMQKHNFDQKVIDYSWKQNRLVKEKEQLKNAIFNLINKKKDEKDSKEAKKSPLQSPVQDS